MTQDFSREADPISDYSDPPKKKNIWGPHGSIQRAGKETARKTDLGPDAGLLAGLPGFRV